MCDVCEGAGRYPIINRFGQELYTIQCPECAHPKSEPSLAPNTVFSNPAVNAAAPCEPNFVTVSTESPNGK